MTFAKPTRRQTLGMLAATGLLAPNLLGKTAFAAAPDTPTGQIVVGFSQEPTVFNPLMPRNEVDEGVMLSIFDAMFRVNPEGEAVPILAAEVPTVENGGISKDGLEWRVKLRDDVKWHDGAPFTAEDVKFTLDLIVDPDFRSWRTLGHNLVRDITIVSPTEITWRMEEPFAPYMSILSETMILPKHILEPEADRNTAPFNQSPIGTGAFKWGERTAGDHIELVANTEYFREGPYIERLIYKYIPDLTVLYTQFKSGDIDIIGLQYISPDNYAEAKDLPGKVVTVVPTSSIECILFNMERPQLKDKVVREALYAALDKQTIIDALYYGLPTPTESYLPQQSFYYNPALPKHEYNL
jgi:peptide/nickel transport system substrate-binding protein